MLLRPFLDGVCLASATLIAYRQRHLASLDYQVEGKGPKHKLYCALKMFTFLQEIFFPY